MNNLTTQAEQLANTFSFEHLKEMEESFEDYHQYYTSEIYDPIRANKSFKLMTLYLLAMSMKELEWPANWKTRGGGNYQDFIKN